MVEGSNLRRLEYLKHGCNAWDKRRPVSTPLSFWTKDDAWEYIGKYNLKYSSIYDIPSVERTGCIFCLFGIIQEMRSGETRFDRLKKTHPQLHDYCMGKLGVRKVLDFLENSTRDNL